MSTRVFGGLEQKREAPPGEKPEPVRTHLRSMIIVPEMIGSIIGVYDGKTFSQVEIKPEMISHYQFHTSLLRMEDLVLVQHTQVKWETLSGCFWIFLHFIISENCCKILFSNSLSHVFSIIVWKTFFGDFRRLIRTVAKPKIRTMHESHK